jgi:hypothetical protein
MFFESVQVVATSLVTGARMITAYSKAPAEKSVPQVRPFDSRIAALWPCVRGSALSPFCV